MLLPLGGVFGVPFLVLSSYTAGIYTHTRTHSQYPYCVATPQGYTYTNVVSVQPEEVYTTGAVQLKQLASD